VKILVVSCHYPPNFVSGGTLQPQRLARGLRDRGHEVSVYAGHIGDDRPAAATFTTCDEVGMDVRWITVTPWTSWADSMNFDNPVVEADFRAHLQVLQPDLVHFHSLQTLGGGVIDVAAGMGITTVVTMHDFWWWCGRQFLVDRGMHPCSVVVDAGVCACEVDRGWLEQRNRRLAASLDKVDLVLAPSASARAVAVANGVDPARLEADENGLPEHPVAGCERHEPSATVRFLYTGGANELKGAAVLLGAAGRLADLDGWSLLAYGALGSQPPAGADPKVRLLPAFAPEDAEHVFAQADVLVVPSVMRESHSIVTREALLRGLPVITTDSLGPEEVVEDGRNGIVVPTGSTEGLADAMRRLVEEPAHLQRLQAHTADVRVRTLDAQIDELDQRFRRLRAAPTRRPLSPTIEHVLFVCGIGGAPLRYRVRLPAEGLALLGVTSTVRHFFDPDIEDLLDRAHALVIYRVPATTHILGIIDRARDRGIPVIFDADDLIFDPELADEIPALEILPADQAALWLEGVRRYRTTMEACDLYVASTPLLARHATDRVGLPTARFDNGVGLLMARRADAEIRRPRRPGPLRMGYLSGTDTHDLDWRFIEPAVATVLERNPTVELWLAGHLVTSDALERFGPRVRRLPFRPWLELPGILRDLDVNLAPLEPGRLFNEAKSSIKWLEAALTETPTVASPTEPFRESVVDGANGVLAEDEDAWIRGISMLFDDPVLRSRIGRRARRDALLTLSPHQQGRRYLALLEQAGRLRSDDRRPSTWEAVVVDEAPRLVALEPYGEPLWRTRTELVQRRLRVGAAKVATSVREDGVLRTSRRFARALGRPLRRLGRRRSTTG
jgi:glycosyltransferase involved in cell wall biosynthesis